MAIPREDVSCTIEEQLHRAQAALHLLAEVHQLLATNEGEGLSPLASMAISGLAANAAAGLATVTLTLPNRRKNLWTRSGPEMGG